MIDSLIIPPVLSQQDQGRDQELYRDIKVSPCPIPAGPEERPGIIQGYQGISLSYPSRTRGETRTIQGYQGIPPVLSQQEQGRDQELYRDITVSPLSYPSRTRAETRYYNVSPLSFPSRTREESRNIKVSPSYPSRIGKRPGITLSYTSSTRG